MFMFYKDAAPTALQRLIHVLQRCRTYGAAPIESRNGDMRFAYIVEPAKKDLLLFSRIDIIRY